MRGLLFALFLFGLIHTSKGAFGPSSSSASSLFQPQGTQQQSRKNGNVGCLFAGHHRPPLTHTKMWMARYSIESDEDFYFTLNVTRDADATLIRKNYRLLAKQYHPDNFVEETKFDPEGLTSKELMAFLASERVGVTAIVDRSDLIDKAWAAHKRTQNVNEELAILRQNISDRFALLNMAYTTLYDENERRAYDLSGDWGIPGRSGKTMSTNSKMGDKEEAKRVRERGMAMQRDSLQNKVYERYMKEKAEKEREDAEYAKSRDERKAREREERRKERARLGLKDLDDMTEEEIREYNQEKIKAMWGNIFSNVFESIGVKKE